jgi:methyl halide transferase
MLDEQYWNNRYATNDAGWDLKEPSPPIKAYIDQLTNKQVRILIPGCGNSYEAGYLMAVGFTNVTVIDIAPIPVQQLQQKFKNNSNIKILQGDFFKHEGVYDLVLEQTFFCALHPSLREAYVHKMESLLAPNGKIAGLLFNTQFEKPGPPFGGSTAEYKELFKKCFEIKLMIPCYNSYYKRAGTEIFIHLKKKKAL